MKPTLIKLPKALSKICCAIKCIIKAGKKKKNQIIELMKASGSMPLTATNTIWSAPTLFQESIYDFENVITQLMKSILLTPEASDRSNTYKMLE